MNTRVGIIGAMDIEVELLKEAMQTPSITTIAGLEFCAGTLSDVSAVVVQCGIGKVNAALCTQVLIDHFCVTHVINTGVAGSLDASIDIGDLVVATDCVQHDFDVCALGYAPGIIPDQAVSFFPADFALRTLALTTAATAVPEVSVYEGRIASGDQFVSGSAAHAHIAEVFKACCCEMEGAALAQVAYANKVPFAVIRAISDKADGSAEMDYPSFKEAAAQRSAALVASMLAQLAGGDDDRTAEVTAR